MQEVPPWSVGCDMRHPHPGGDDPAVAALARWQAAKRTSGFLMEAALAPYEDQTWEDAAKERSG
jgi:hypothetical protein